MDDKLKDLLSNIPRTKEEFDKLRMQVADVTNEQLLEKAQKVNTQIDIARKVVRMFEKEEFQEFWRAIYTDAKSLCDRSPASIRGNPFEKLDQLAIIQGGLDMLESQQQVKEKYEALANREPYNIEALKEKLINRVDEIV